MTYLQLLLEINVTKIEYSYKSKFDQHRHIYSTTSRIFEYKRLEVSLIMYMTIINLE